MAGEDGMLTESGIKRRVLAVKVMRRAMCHMCAECTKTNGSCSGLEELATGYVEEVLAAVLRTHKK